jgi:DNA repair exonuclease SbcCD ATPase subunit
MIKSIELYNWKVFHKLKLNFLEGINFITGPNGIGKSSILQAICLAFTGRIPDMLKTSTLADFIHKGAETAQIDVKFKFRNESLHIRRKISMRGRGLCAIFDAGGREIFSGKWGDVTKYIETLYNIRAPFFEAILYMSEGDVYRTIHEPPGRVLLDEIDEALGIKRLQVLRSELKSLAKEFKKKETRHRAVLREAELTIETWQDIQEMSVKLDEKLKIRDAKRKEIEIIESELWELRNQLRINEKLVEDLELLASKRKALEEERIQIQSLQKQLEKIKTRLKAKQREQMRADAEISNLEKILDLLEHTQRPKGAKIKCPVCRRPISEYEVKEIRKQTTKKIDKLRQVIRDLVEKIDGLTRKRYNIESRLNEFKEKEARLRMLQEQIPIEIKDISKIQKKAAHLRKRIQVLEVNRKKTEELLRDIELEIGRLRERIAASRAVARRDVERVQSDLKLASKGAYISQFVVRGVEEFIRKQRDSELGTRLYEYISRVWNSFRREEGWSMRLDEHGVPLLRLESEAYPFSSLSGGEKTALLVVTRTALSKLLAEEIGFLLLDEPIEHLDSRNRRSLLQFLVDAYTRQMVGQLIVATVEESLLNRFMDYESVNIIPLESIQSVLKR